jgi:hypothetical protein
MITTNINFSDRRRLIFRWFLIGFLARAALAIVITLLMVRSFESAMLYLADFPTILCFALVERLSPSVARQLAGNDPFYIPFNILGALIWGFLFMLVALAFSLIKSRGNSWLIRAKSQKGAVQRRA